MFSFRVLGEMNEYELRERVRLMEAGGLVQAEVLACVEINQ